MNNVEIGNPVKYGNKQSLENGEKVKDYRLNNTTFQSVEVEHKKGNGPILERNVCASKAEWIQHYQYQYNMAIQYSLEYKKKGDHVKAQEYRDLAGRQWARISELQKSSL